MTKSTVFFVLIVAFVAAVNSDTIEVSAVQNQECNFDKMPRAEFVALSTLYKKSCRVSGGGLLDGLICSLINILGILNLTLISDIAKQIGIDLTGVVALVQGLLGTVKNLLSGGLGGGLGGVTGGLGGITGILGGLGGLGGLTGGLGGLGGILGGLGR